MGSSLQIKALRRVLPNNWIPNQTNPAQPKTIGEHIKRRRLELRLLQRDVAGQIGVHHESVKNWERGVLKPMIRHLPRIIEFLGYNPEPKPKPVAERIVHIRRQLGMTQEAMAKALAIDPATLWRWENGCTTPPEPRIAQLDGLVVAEDIIRR